MQHMIPADPRKATRECVPGSVLRTMISGSGPGAAGYSVAASELEGTYYVSLLEFYDPATHSAPKAQYDVPPTPEGVVVRYREAHDDPVSAGEDFGSFKTLLLQEGLIQNGEPERVGLNQLIRVVENHRKRVMFDRLHSHPELEDDPDYREELESLIASEIPDEHKREALDSLSRLGRRRNTDTG